MAHEIETPSLLDQRKFEELEAERSNIIGASFSAVHLSIDMIKSIAQAIDENNLYWAKYKTETLLSLMEGSREKINEGWITCYGHPII
jgi:hypothetical protein